MSDVAELLQQLIRLDAYNGGTASSTITLSCPRQTARIMSLSANRLATIDTGWTGICTSTRIWSPRCAGWSPATRAALG